MKVATIHAPDAHWFLDGIESTFRREHEVRRFEVANSAQLREALAWADVVWCEFADEIAAAASKSGHPGVIVRMHSYEAYGKVAAIQWGGVARLVYTAAHVYAIAQETAPEIASVPATLLPSAVDTVRYALQPHRMGHRIGLVAWVRPEKAIHDAIQILADIRSNSDPFTLDIAGACDMPQYGRYLDHLVESLGLGDAVRFLGHVEDIPKFWSEHDHCLSGSIREDCPYNVLEAMACGVRPTVHRYLGAEAQFPADLVYAKQRDGAIHLQTCVTRDRRPQADDVPGAAYPIFYESERYRQIVLDRYSIEGQAAALLGLVADVGGHARGEPDSQEPATGSDSQALHHDTAPSEVLCSLGMIALVRDVGEYGALAKAVRSVDDAIDESVVVLDERSQPFSVNGIDRVERRAFASFSDQRNHAASLCRGEWVLVLDADDYFESVGDLRRCMETAPADVNAIDCEEITVDENGTEIERGTATVAYRRRACHWKYHGHNELIGRGEKRVMSTAVMVYRHPWDEDGKAHARRTIPLLMRDLAEDPNDPHAPYFLARAYYMLDDWAEVAKWAEKTIQLAPQSLGHSPAWFLLANAVHRLHGLSAAAQIVEQAMKLHPRMPDLLDLGTMMWFSRWAAACRDPANPYLATSQQTPKRLPTFESVAEAHGWMLKSRGAA